MERTEKRSITAEDLYQFQLMSGARISPSGQHVVYSVQRVDQKTEKKYTNLWIVATDGQSPARQLTYGDHVDGKPCWSPDGSQIAFLSNRGDKEKAAQIYLLPLSGGEARPLTHLDGSFQSLVWSPDGKQLLCVARKTDAEVLEREKDEQKKKLGAVARHYDRMNFKLDGFGYLPKERWHLWLVNAENGEAKQLTDHAIYDEQQADWSPDGKQIVFVSNRSENPDKNPDWDDLYVMPSEGGTMRKIETPQGNKAQPSFSPDGIWLAYYAQEGVGISYRNQNLWVVPADGSGAACNLTGSYDVHVSASTINDMGEAETMPPTWTLDGERIYFPMVLHGSSLVMSIGRAGE